VTRDERALIYWADMNSGKRCSLGLFVIALLFTTMFAQAGGNGWLPGWADDLGLKLEKVPAPDEDFALLKGQVTDATKAAAFFGAVKAGDEVELKYSGNVAWLVETDAGKVRPCVVKGSLVGSQKTVTLVPDNRTRKLKLGPPPFKGSARVSGGN
jgi:hypothetical protein